MNRLKTRISMLSIVLMLAICQSVQAQDFTQADQQSTKVEIYPNPTTDYLIVDLSQLNLANAQFELRSMIGNEINAVPEQLSLTKYRFQVKDYASGYYFLIIKDDQSQFKNAYRFLKN